MFWLSGFHYKCCNGIELSLYSGAFLHIKRETLENEHSVYQSVNIFEKQKWKDEKLRVT